MDAVILCGGEGTRIRHLLPEGTPKCMTDINGVPFIEILVDSLRGIEYDCEHPSKFGDHSRFIFATGYGAGKIESYLQARYRFGMHGYRWWEFSCEKKPLGTAGAIKYMKKELYHGAIYPELLKPPGDPFFIFNGDTICDVDYEAMLKYHEATNPIITIACDKNFRQVGTFIASRRFIDFIPPDCKVDMAEVFTLLGQKHEPVGWFYTDAPFYDIGDEIGLKTFRDYWRQVQLPKGGEEQMLDNRKDTL